MEKHDYRCALRRFRVIDHGAYCEMYGWVMV